MVFIPVLPEADEDSCYRPWTSCWSVGPALKKERHRLKSGALGFAPAECVMRSGQLGR